MDGCEAAGIWRRSHLLEFEEALRVRMNALFPGGKSVSRLSGCPVWRRWGSQKGPPFAALVRCGYGCDNHREAGNRSTAEHKARTRAQRTDVELRSASVLDYRIWRPGGRVTMLYGSLGTHRALSQI